MRKLLSAHLLILIFILGVSKNSFSQRFGGHPPRVKWKQVNTDTVRVIFPTGLDSQAQRVASLVHYQASKVPVPLNTKLHKIDIVLQNQTTVANAYVALGPYRSEFYMNPSLNNFEEGTIPWGDNLSIHEYRHVQQYNSFHVGLSQLMNILFGQDGYSVAVDAAIPNWFFEGDAVYNETILSNQGRGRIPLFLNTYPSLWQAGKKYSWMKLRNGSLKDYVPDHYDLGYLLVNYGREKYGLDFWSKVTKDAAAFKGLFYPFQHAIKKYSGLTFQTFYADAFAYYKKLQALQQSVQASETGPIHSITPVNKKVVTNYLFPYSISADSLVYLKMSYNRRPGFYIKDKSGEHRLRTRDIAIDDQFSYRHGKIAYAAYETDPRWSWWDYSVIKVYDIASGKQITIGGKKRYEVDPVTHARSVYAAPPKSKYFSPDISPSGEKIAVVQVASDGKSELHILDAKSGDIINRLGSFEVNLFTDPKFIDENKLICVVRLTDGRAALAIADMAASNIERLTPPSFNVIGYPCVNGDRVYFTAAYGGNDDVFALRLTDKKIFRVTKGTLGNYFVNAAEGKITWSTFTAEGYQLEQMDEKDVELTEMPDPAIVETKFPVSHNSEVHEILLNPAVEHMFPVTKYKKATGFFNFHSWRPYYDNPEFTFTLYGQNVMNNVQTEIYYLYNQDDKTNATGVNFIYGAWFPYLSFGTQYTFDKQVTVNNRVKQWDQLDSRVGFNIPLSWVTGRTFTDLNFGSSYFYRNDFNKGVNKDLFTQVNFSYLSHFINFSQQTEMARQHIYPKLGYDISLNYRHAITNYKSWQPFVAGDIFLPGFFPTHSIVLNGAFQETDTLYALFSNRFPYSRGYNEGYFAEMWKLGANYHFPIFYADFGFANIVYLQRIRGNIFYDLTRVYSRNKQATRDQSSCGIEIYLDTNWWNQYPLTFGFRISHLLDDDLFNRTGMPAGSNWFEFLVPISIIPR